MRKRIAFCLISAGLAATSFAAEPQGSPAALFGSRETIQHIDLSPDGTRVVYVAAGPQRSSIAFVQALDGSPRATLRSSGDPERLHWCNFVTDDRLICRVGMMLVEDGLLLPYSRLVSIDSDGSNLQRLGERSTGREAYVSQFDVSVLDWLPGQDGEILLSREHVPDSGRGDTRMVREERGLGVDRVNVRTLQFTRVERPNQQAGYYLSDGRGNVRMMAVPDVRGSTGQLGRSTEYFYRTEDSRSWRSFSTFRGSEGMLPIAIDASLNAAYVLQKLNGRYALYRVKLDGSMHTDLVFAHERVDVDDVVRISRGSRVIGVTFAEEKRHVVYFDEEYARLASDLGQAIPHLPMVRFAGASADDQRLLIHAGSDSDPGRYFLFDRRTRQLAEIALSRPALEGVQLASVRPVTYPARDGVGIPGYLTLPPGRDPRNLPAVVLPHGGPSARDEWGFDWLAQYLANQGYAVLQPNYRGSAGFGDAWLQRNGFQSWETSVGDITAGARWLAEEGIADPQRVAIVGWSYGGYAALQAGAVDPEMFKAIVAIAPVTDLIQLRQDARPYTHSRNVADFIGSGPHLRTGSPLHNVAQIRAPVLLFHGDRDLNVNVIHSRQMHDALRTAGRQSELTIFEGLEHDLDDSAARTEMLAKIGAFLAAAVGRGEGR